MTRFSIKVKEYESVGGAEMAATGPFVFNDLQLVVSIARSILTVNHSKATRKYMAAIVKPTLRFLLDWSRAPDLCLSSDFMNVVRDFSVTGRIGELAQGVSWAYWKWGKRYAWITDFESWASKLSPPYMGKKSPDYVMLNATTGTLAFMEAKGTRSANHKPPMYAALRQCKDALAHGSIAKQGFGCVLTLDSKNPKGAGALHIRDPESSSRIPDELMYYVFRRSYASWFDLSGDQDQARRLREIPVMEAIDIQIDPVDRFARRSDPLRAMTAEALGFDPEQTKFVIDSDISEAIQSFDAFKSVNWNALSARMRDLQGTNHRAIRFPDGTRIVED